MSRFNPMDMNNDGSVDYSDYMLYNNYISPSSRNSRKKKHLSISHLSDLIVRDADTGFMLSDSDYSLEMEDDGTVTLTFEGSYLDTLTPGRHSFAVSDGRTTCNVSITIPKD